MNVSDLFTSYMRPNKYARPRLQDKKKKLDFYFLQKSVVNL